MNEHQKKDLVDRFLLGQTTAEETQLLHQFRETDPDFDQYVKESELAFQALSLARRKKLKEKLRGLDDLAKKKKSGGGMMLFLITILGILFSWNWITFHFSPVLLAEKYFHANQLYEWEPIDQDEIWNKGQLAFQQERFDSSVFYFASIASEKNNTAQLHAQWNLLLSQLALHGPTLKWQDDLRTFLFIAPPEIKKDTRALLSITRSQLYQFVYMGKWKKAVRVVKTKII